MKSLKIQPTLTPCNGSLDLISDISPCGEFIELTWGTTLFLRIPQNRQTAIFRIIAGLFCQFGFEQEAVSGFLGVSTKTLRRWRNCLVEGTWDSLSMLFEGIHPGRLPEHLVVYVRKRYRDFVAAGQVSPVHRYNQTICDEVKRYWGVDVCCETLRLIFRSEDKVMRCEAGMDAKSIPLEEEPPAGDEGVLSRDMLCDEAHERPAASASGEPDRTSHCEGSQELPSARAGAPKEVSAQASSPVPKGAASIAPAPAMGVDVPHIRGPVISGGRLKEPMVCAHAGLFILSPWFETAFGQSRPIIRQTAAQILLGEVNQEQAKNVCYASLGLFTSELKRSPMTQRQLLDYEVMMGSTLAVWQRNAVLTGASRIPAYYFDPNVVTYNGIKKFLLTWSGLDKAPKKGINLDFFHTIDGKPCYIGHDDGFYDARQRFLMIVEQMRWLIEVNQRPLTFVQDRGFWGDEFMKAMITLGLCFIQWEKNYDGTGWDAPFEREGKMSIIRRKNSSKDKRKVRFTFREQIWPAHPNGRRIIVQTYCRKKKFEQFSIVTNDPDMRTEEVIRLMFNRWVQEGDFSYENRHFGMQQLTSRKTDTYAALEDSLEDREIDSRDYKKARHKKTSIQSKLGKMLLKLSKMPDPSPTAIKARVKRLKERSSKLQKELTLINAQDTPQNLIDRIGNRIKNAMKRKKTLEQQEKELAKRQDLKKEIEQIKRTLEDHAALMAIIPKKESRLKAVIDEGKVKPNMGRKALVDAIRATSRNVFCEPHQIFRSNYDNYREDHVTLRQLTQSPGVITQAADGTVAIYLTPQLDRQPAQWRRIRTFLDIVEHRIRQQLGVIIRFHIQKSNAEIFEAASRMKKRLKS